MGNQSYVMGVETAGGLGIEVEYLQDDQFFGDDDTAWLVLGSRRF